MALNKKFFSNNYGGVMILIAVIFPLLLIVLDLTIETSRLYAVQVKAQNAADTALRGAVATLSTINVNDEAKRLFYANFPDGYMNSQVGTIAVNSTAAGAYSITVPINVPSLLNIFTPSPNHNGNPQSTNALLNNNAHNTSPPSSGTLTITSQVVSGYQAAPTQYLELALVLDNTGSMADPIGGGASKISALQAASKDLINILYGTANSLDNMHVSIVPFDTDVNVGNNRASWVQAAYVGTYNAQSAAIGGGNGFLANRNRDNAPNTLNDITDAAPTTDATRFRVPPYIYPAEPVIYGPIAGYLWCCGYPDFIYKSLAPVKFGMNAKTDIINEINLMAPSGNTRINIGLMWGWFTLSPKWQGLWDTGSPGLPANFSANVKKEMVLMTDGENTVWGNWYMGGTSDDDKTTAYLCEAIKAQGITIYTIGLGAPGDYNQPLLQNCASQSSYFFAAPTTAQLSLIFHQIADNLVYETLHTSQ